MASTIAMGVKDGRTVTLSQVSAGEKGITCYTCGGTLCVKDGKGTHISAEGGGRRSVAKGKHFAHTEKSKCYGEGPAHYRLKKTIARALNEVVRDLRGFPAKTTKPLGMNYPCPNAAYGVHCHGRDVQPFRKGNSMMGSHWFDLLRNLTEVKTEHWLGNRETRPDIVGLDATGRPVWIIEIYRTHKTSKRSREYAEKFGIPLFQVNIDDIPRDSNSDNPFQELESERYELRADNAERGFFFADKSWNTSCEREAFGMPPEVHRWSRILLKNDDGTETVVHQCGEEICPDHKYMWRNNLSSFEMYLDPERQVHSHTYLEEDQ